MKVDTANADELHTLNCNSLDQLVTQEINELNLNNNLLLGYTLISVYISKADFISTLEAANIDDAEAYGVDFATEQHIVAVPPDQRFITESLVSALRCISNDKPESVKVLEPTSN